MSCGVFYFIQVEQRGVQNTPAVRGLPDFSVSESVQVTNCKYLDALCNGSQTNGYPTTVPKSHKNT